MLGLGDRRVLGIGLRGEDALAADSHCVACHVFHDRTKERAPGPVDVASIKAVAVSVEPDNVPAVTPTKVLFAAPLGE